MQKKNLSYLQFSGKIEFTPDCVVWIFMPKEDIDKIFGYKNK